MNLVDIRFLKEVRKKTDHKIDPCDAPKKTKQNKV